MPKPAVDLPLPSCYLDRPPLEHQIPPNCRPTDGLGKCGWCCWVNPFQNLSANPAVCLGEKWIVYLGVEWTWCHENGWPNRGWETGPKPLVWTYEMDSEKQSLKSTHWGYCVMSSFTVWTGSSYLLYPFFKGYQPIDVPLNMHRRRDFNRLVTGIEDELGYKWTF